ncbi:PEP/pyruvate-binding domain-containing protein [Isoptericola jiangsuensis]|uniref:PEP/pyruvate-binding domain-containing protein n=1 Tax=Isoptericola jiangsuensis TaxID=548579 RepID=UPI003AB07FC8
MIVPLRNAVAATCGPKAGVLGALLRAGFPVPDGFVVPFEAHRTTLTLDVLAPALQGVGDGPVAVRSSATGEDTGHRSAAGQHESVLAVSGVEHVARAIVACWDSLHSPRAVAYRGTGATDSSREVPTMAVVVQRLVDAEVSGVLFTAAAPGGAATVEASWGLGPSVVEGTVTPDAYRVEADGTITRTVGEKRTRLDRDTAPSSTGLVVSDVPTAERRRPALDDAAVTRLVRLGHDVAARLGGPQDVEWALADGRLWLLQARPVTAALPPARSGPSAPPGPREPGASLTGTPAGRGIATGTARIVAGPADFSRVRPGDILVCPLTDPAWTPLLRIVGGVVTETGGVLSHAAIVAREQRIPAVLGVAGATTAIRDGVRVTIDGATGSVELTVA